jgi:hypothetical protein
MHELHKARQRRVDVLRIHVRAPGWRPLRLVALLRHLLSGCGNGGYGPGSKVRDCFSGLVVRVLGAWLGFADVACCCQPF